MDRKISEKRKLENSKREGTGTRSQRFTSSRPATTEGEKMVGRRLTRKRTTSQGQRKEQQKDDNRDNTPLVRQAGKLSLSEKKVIRTWKKRGVLFVGKRTWDKLTRGKSERKLTSY